MNFDSRFSSWSFFSSSSIISMSSCSPTQLTRRFRSSSSSTFRLTWNNPLEKSVMRFSFSSSSSIGSSEHSNTGDFSMNPLDFFTEFRLNSFLSLKTSSFIKRLLRAGLVWSSSCNAASSTFGNRKGSRLRPRRSAPLGRFDLRTDFLLMPNSSSSWMILILEMMSLLSFYQKSEKLERRETSCSSLTSKTGRPKKEGF